MATREFSQKKTNTRTTSGRTRATNQSHAQTASAARKSQPRLRPLVGEPWDDGEEEVPLGTESAKNSIIIWMAILFGGLLVTLTIYAMLHGNQKTLDSVLQIDELGLVFIAAWATGKAALKVLGGWKGI